MAASPNYGPFWGPFIEGYFGYPQFGVLNIRIRRVHRKSDPTSDFENPSSSTEIYPHRPHQEAPGARV